MSPKPLQAAGFQWSSCVSLAVKRKRSGLAPFPFQAFILPPGRPTMETLSAERKRLRQADKRITVVGQDDKALIDYMKSHALSCHQSVPLFLSLSLLCWPTVNQPHTFSFISQWNNVILWLQFTIRHKPALAARGRIVVTCQFPGTDPVPLTGTLGLNPSHMKRKQMAFGKSAI